MATPTYPSRRYYCAGSRRGTAWGTALALGANYGVLITGDSGIKRTQAYEPYPAIDQLIPKDGWLGISAPVELTPPVNLQYEAGPVGAWLAAIFGTAGAPANAGTNAYEHTFQYADSVTHFFTYAEERPGHIWEVPSAMPYKAVLKPNGAAIGATITLRGNSMIDDSAVNAANQMDAMTYLSRSTFLHFSHGAFKMNTQAANALGANDAVEISDFEVSFERAIDAVHVAGGVNIAEPKEGDIPVNTLKITLPRASNNNVDYFSTWEDMTAMKASLIFTGAACGNNVYAVSFYFPRLVLMSPPDVKLDGVIKNDLIFSMQEAANAPGGMNYVRPYMRIVNSANADYLA